jgi:hypothetical protein
LYVTAWAGKDAAKSRVIRAPPDGGAPQLVVAAPGIGNIACSRAPASMCIYSQQSSTQLIFTAFDPVSGTSHQVARVQRESGIENSGLSPDGQFIAVIKWARRTSSCYCLQVKSRNRVEKLEFFFFHRLGDGFERAFCYEQSDGLEVQLAVCGPGGKCAPTLAGGRCVAIVGYRVARREVPGDSGADDQQ